MSNELELQFLNEAWRELVPPPSLPPRFVEVKRTDQLRVTFELPNMESVWCKLVTKALDAQI